MRTKNRKRKVLLLENIHPDAVKAFRAEGYEVQPVHKALDEKALGRALKGVSILGIRSKTKITAKVLGHATDLEVIGAFCIGTNQIDTKECNRRGVAVFNAPYSNTRSVVELVIGEIIMLFRRLAEKNKRLHSGSWDKNAEGSFEVRGKKLGIVGYGHIGSQLSVLGEALGMEIFFFDTEEKLALGNAKKCHSLPELLKKSDIVTLHVDGRKENKNLISDRELRAMKPGSYLLNISRGNVVDLKALFRHLKSGHLAGAGIDVFPEEPESNGQKFRSILQGLDNVILTPHIGGSTKEAQENIASYVSSRIIDFMALGNTNMSINLPNVGLPYLKNRHRIIHLHENVPGMLGKINEVFASRKINITGQYLKTRDTLGYAITDIESSLSKDALRALGELPFTIKAKVLY